MDELSKYINGEDTIYAEVIQSLRSFLNSIEAVKNSKGGALIFFTGKNEIANDLNVKIFPLNPNTPLLSTNELSHQQKIDIFAILNKQQSYKGLWHYSEFRLKYKTDEHLTTQVPSECVITYDEMQINYNGKSETWSTFYEELKNGAVNKHISDQLLIESGCKKISYIPLPVLSTPFVLLVINNNIIKHELSSLLRSMYFRSRDSISKHLYSRLMISMMGYLKGNIKNIEEIDLVEKYVLELCNIFLPISFRINSQDEKPYYTLWPSKDISSSYTLSLLDKKYSVYFKLTSFAFTDFEHTSSKYELPLFHTSEIYKATIMQSSALISKLFDLIHQNWNLLRSTEQKIYRSILKTISPINISGLVTTVHHIKQEFDKIKEVAKGLDSSPFNKLLVSDNKVTLLIHGKKILELVKTRSYSLIAGFKYLQFLLERSKENNNRFCISARELFEQKPSDRRNRRNPTPERKKRALEEAEELINVIERWIKSSMLEITICKKRNIISDKSEFNAALYSYAKVLKYMNDTKVFGLYRGRSGKIIEILKPLLRMYSDNDENFANIVKSRDISPFEEEFQKVRNQIYQADENRISNDYVKSSFIAMFKVISEAYNNEEEKSETKVLLELFIKNLENAGLKKAGIDAAEKQNKYCYNQDNIINPIEWEF